MRREIHFLRRNMELLLARAEAAERGRQDPPLLLPPPPEGERPVPALPNDEPPGQLGPLGLPEPQQPQVEAHMEKYGGDYEDEIEQVHEVGALLEGAAASWYVGLYRSRAPELRSFPHFMLACGGSLRIRLRKRRPGSGYGKSGKGPDP
uniref:Uncharacterized protein n=1 Tax=Sphaerodactylus townsendi TaxID=933632 RepID=A0ACB8EM14_9SAUR